MDVCRTFYGVTAIASLLMLSACGRSEGGSVSVQPQSLPAEGTMSQVPVGQLAGAAADTLGPTISNPYGSSPQAIHEGRALYLKMNCAGCHGYGAKGNMGPDLTDKYWRYGGAPANVYKSIYDGRPKGMPAWGLAMPPQEIWKIVAYIQSLGGTVPAGEFQRSKEGDVSDTQVAPEVTKARRAATNAQNGSQPAPQLQPSQVQPEGTGQ